jgi:hypothetical protein
MHSAGTQQHRHLARSLERIIDEVQDRNTDLLATVNMQRLQIAVLQQQNTDFLAQSRQNQEVANTMRAHCAVLSAGFCEALEGNKQLQDQNTALQLLLQKQSESELHTMHLVERGVQDAQAARTAAAQARLIAAQSFEHIVAKDALIRQLRNEVDRLRTGCRLPAALS